MAVGARVGFMSWEVLLLPKASTSCPPGERALEKIVLTVPGLRNMVQNKLLGLLLSAI
jgi:hypothetical protein